MAAATRMVRDLGKVIAVSLTAVSCLKTEVINATEQEQEREPTQKQRKELEDFPQPCDTARVPIEFNPSVEDWDEYEDINI